LSDANITKKYYKSGNLRIKEYNNVNNGVYEEYYENGQLYIQGHILKLALFYIGKWKEWYETVH